MKKVHKYRNYNISKDAFVDYIEEFEEFDDFLSDSMRNYHNLTGFIIPRSKFDFKRFKSFSDVITLGKKNWFCYYDIYKKNPNYIHVKIAIHGPKNNGFPIDLLQYTFSGPGRP